MDNDEICLTMFVFSYILSVLLILFSFFHLRLRPPSNFVTGEKGLHLRKNIPTPFQSLAANSTVFFQGFFSQPVDERGHNTRTKKNFTFPLARTNRFRNSFIPRTIRKLNFSHCSSCQFSHYFLFFINLLYGMSCLLFFIIFLSVQPYGCKDNKILSYLILSSLSASDFVLAFPIARLLHANGRMHTAAGG